MANPSVTLTLHRESSAIVIVRIFLRSNSAYCKTNRITVKKHVNRFNQKLDVMETVIFEI